MKKLTTSFIAISMIFFFISCGNTEKKPEAEVQEATVPDTEINESSDAASAIYQLNTENSLFTWGAEKKLVDWGHNGTIQITEGSLETEGGNVTGGNFTIDMSSIIVLNIDDPKKNADFLGHMASDDFFSVSNYPTATFIITSSVPAKDNPDATNTVTGNLTIKGITNSISFPAIISVTEGAVSAKTAFTIDRSKWEIKYDSESFFDNLGDKIIKDEIEIGLNLEFTTTGD